MIFADESFTFDNYLQMDTIKCYSEKEDIQFHFFGVQKTPKCRHSDAYFRRHCLLVEKMEWWRENDFIYVIDSDVIFHGHESTWKNPGENIDLIFYERWWNGEIMAGRQSVSFST